MSVTKEELKAQLKGMDYERNCEHTRVLSESEYDAIKIELLRIVDKIAPGCVKVLQVVGHTWGDRKESPSLEEVHDCFFELIDSVTDRQHLPVFQRKITTGGLYVQFDLRDNSCRAGVCYEDAEFGVI